MRSPPIRMDYKLADNIIRSYNEKHEGLLRDIIASVIPERGYAESLEYRELLHQARRVKGVAEKMLRSRDEAEQPRTSAPLRSLDSRAVRASRQLSLF